MQVYKSKPTGWKTARQKKVIEVADYVAELEDKDMHLVFVNPCNFTIPANLFAIDDEIQGEAGADFVTVIAGANMTVNCVISQKLKVPQYGVFGLTIRNANQAVLFGQLIPL